MVETSKKAFARRLNQACEQRGMPVRGRRVLLAKIVNVSGEAARKWLSGEAIPAMDHVSTLASYLKVTVQWLLTGEDRKDVIEAGSLTDEEQAHLNRLRCLPPSERARVFRLSTSLCRQHCRNGTRDRCPGCRVLMVV